MAKSPFEEPGVEKGMTKGTGPKLQLKDSELARLSLSVEQQNAISQLYKKTYLDLKKQVDALPHGGGTSESLQKTYLNKLVKQLNESYKSIGTGLEEQIKNGMGTVASSVVKDVNAFAEKLGLTMEGSYSYVPRDIVSMLATGQVYGGDWSLSKSIWGNSQKNLQDINSIVAVGVAANKSAYEIAKDLEKYVDPSAKKDWNWSKVYPGTSKRVDYNAQRLARTMVSHAYQQSLMATTKHNPFVTGLRWRSAHSYRTCDICNSRDGTVYPKDDLPMDHPNGMCTFIAEIPDSMNDIANRLGDWGDGKEDPDIDRWYNSMNGNSILKVVTPEQKKEATKTEEVGSTKWIDQNLNNMRKNITRNFGKEAWGTVSGKLSSLDETQLRWLASGNNRLSSLINDNGKGYSLAVSRTISVDLLKDISKTQSKGQFSTLFHEYGHLLDAKYGSAGGSLSSSGKFGKSIYKSIQTEYNYIVDKVTGKLDPVVRDYLLVDDQSAGVQDIISGMSGDKNRIKWGHSSKYWERQGVNAWKEVTSEAFANMNEAYINGGKANQYFEEFFPDSYRLFKEEVSKRVTKTLE